jgi:rod shape-determining protein MreD
MTSRVQQHLRLFALGVVALILSGIPLPFVVDVFRPEFLLLLVLWMVLYAESHSVLTIAWLAGLLLDAFHGSLLGENALAFMLISYIVRHYYQRIRAFPPLHQNIVILILLIFEELIVFWIDGLTGRPLTHWTRWLETLASAVLWQPACWYIPRWIKRPML